MEKKSEHCYYLLLVLVVVCYVMCKRTRGSLLGTVEVMLKVAAFCTGIEMEFRKPIWIATQYLFKHSSLHIVCFLFYFIFVKFFLYFKV